MKLSTPWIVLAAVIAFVTWSAGMVAWGQHIEGQAAELKATQVDNQAARALVNANDQVHDTEADLQQGMSDRDQKLQQEKTDEQVKSDVLLAGLRDGTTRLSVATRVPICPARPGAAATTASQPQEARAELDPATAADLAAIAREGDDAIRELNATIDDYNAAREALKALARLQQQPSPSSQPE